MYLLHVFQYKFATDLACATRNGRDKSLGSKRGAGTASETTIQRWRREKKLRRIDGVRSTLHNPIPEKFGELQIIHSLKDIFEHFEDVQINSIIPEIENFEFVNSKLGKVAGRSVLSDQQQHKFTNDPKIHMNIDGPEKPPEFDLLEPVSQYSFEPSLEQLNFMEGLCVTQAQSNLYEEETREQADIQKWHDLRAQRFSSTKFKEVCTRRADYESLAARQLKKTIQTAAMRHGINTVEEAAAAYADIRV